MGTCSNLPMTNTHMFGSDYAGPSEDTQPISLPAQGRVSRPVVNVPSKALGMRKSVGVVLDDERVAQWGEDKDFRRAIQENLAEEFPTADRVHVYTQTGACLTAFDPAAYLTQDPTAKYIRTDVDGSYEPFGLPPITKVIPIPGVVRAQKAGVK